MTVNNVVASSTSSLTASFAVDVAAATGARTVTVATANGTSSTQTFTVNPSTPAPTLATVTPATGTAGTTANVTLAGTNFISGATTVSVSGTGVTVGTVTVVSATSLTTSFIISASATAGARNVTVTTAGGTSAAQTFTIPQAVASLNPWPNPAYKGLTGKGVVIAILDRGIQLQHPDFINPDGTTRIKAMLDMSGQSQCAAGNPTPIEYTEAQINAALNGGAPLPELDAVGHGNVTAGIAAGNGRAAASGRFAGVAPEADLIIVKVTSEGAPAHGTQAAEAPFVACYSQALDWLDTKLATLGKPAAVLINSGVLLWGPTDGTSALSRRIDQSFNNKPGRIFISPSGDEGDMANHAGGTFSSTATTVNFTRTTTTASQFALWYTGAQTAQVTVVFDDGTTVGPIGPGQSTTASGVTVGQYVPGQEFYPVTSTGAGDRFVSCCDGRTRHDRPPPPLRA